MPDHKESAVNKGTINLGNHKCCRKTATDLKYRLLLIYIRHDVAESGVKHNK